MGKKKKDKKVKGKEKTERKEAKKADKREKKRQKQAGEEDIEAIIAQMEMEDKERRAVKVEHDVPPPSPRANGSWVMHKEKDQAIQFGGEYFNGEKTYFYNETYKYHTQTNAWTCLSGAGAPTPRSAHQACIVRWGGSDFMFVFGGEFSNSVGTQFYHYGDMWRLDLVKDEWERVEYAASEGSGGSGKKGKGKGHGKQDSRPSARSGHRMVSVKGKILLFGGFNETGKGSKYFNDTWLYDVEANRWSEIKDAANNGPSPRSGCQLAAHGDGVFLFGGFCKRAVGDNDVGQAYSDVWHIKPNSEAPRWEKVKARGAGPTHRCSFGMAVFKDRRALYFGGVEDTDGGDVVEGEEDSRFYNDIFSFDLDSKKWFALPLKKPKAPKDKLGGTAVPAESVAAPSAIGGLLANSQVSADGAEDDGEVGGDGDDVDAMESLMHDMPHPRYSAGVAIKGNMLYLYGGSLEVGDRDVTFDDVWRINVQRMDQWECLYEGTVEKHEWKGDIDNEDEKSGEGADAASDDEEDDEEDEEEDEDEAMDDGSGVAGTARGLFTRTRKRGPDYSRTPKPGESLKDFYERTVNLYTADALQTGQYGGKTLRRQAFILAQARYEAVAQERKEREDAEADEEAELT